MLPDLPFYFYFYFCSFTLPVFLPPSLPSSLISSSSVCWVSATPGKHSPPRPVLTSRVFPSSGKRRYPRPRFPRETLRGLPRSRFLWRTLFFRSHSVLNIRISCQRLETRRPRMGSRHSGLSASVRGGRRCLSLHSPSRRSKANNGHHNQHTQSEMRQLSRVSLILFQFSHPRERGLKTERRRTISGVPNYTHTQNGAFTRDRVALGGVSGRARGSVCVCVHPSVWLAFSSSSSPHIAGYKSNPLFIFHSRDILRFI